VTSGVYIEGVGELRERGDFSLNRLERAAVSPQRLSPARDVSARVVRTPGKLAKIVQPGSLQELDEAMDVATVDVPRAEPPDEALVHSTFLAPDCTDAAEQRLRLPVQILWPSIRPHILRPPVRFALAASSVE